MTEKTGAGAEHPNYTKRDLIIRGDYQSSPVGRAVFFIARALDPFLQYAILAQGLGAPTLHRIGLRTLGGGLPAHTGIGPVDNLGLSPYRLTILSMAVGSMIKQNIWVTTIGAEAMLVKTGVIVGIFNAVWNSLNSYMAITAATSVSDPTESNLTTTLPIVVGTTMYTVGILAELISEIQRKRFKADPKNKGKLYTGGLWSLARNINYGAYTIWRAGYGVATGGWIWGAIIAAFFLRDFSARGVPEMEDYCQTKYPAEFEKFKKQTPWRLIPYVY